MKLLTVIVPVYNMRKWLERCLQSLDDLRLQSCLEVLVVDDGSTDDSLIAARRFETKSPDVFRVVTQENGGHGAAINTGLRLAEGEYVRVVDADDWVNADALYNVLHCMEKQDCDIYVDERTRVDYTSGTYQHYPLPKSIRSGVRHPLHDLTMKQLTTCVNMHTLTVRTELMRKSGVQLPEHSYYVDMEYVIAALSFVHTVCLVSERVYHYQSGNPEQSSYYTNLVKNYDQYSAVVFRCIEDYMRNCPQILEGDYVLYSIAQLICRQLRIALVYDTDKKRGRIRARALRAELQRCPAKLWYFSEGQYMFSMLFNRFGLGFPALKWLRAALRRIHTEFV